ncbi:putative glutathione transferase [Phaeomoniella chlamydospora]|uniref:Putative glutathione transferase n=1 Tax=Phaeomoniella chlamydospora TaxID=158046 RepID=A0A0G2GES9_PHACM|nr:putative glutathione transferase [Phaeomoniella chlamydospora]
MSLKSLILHSHITGPNPWKVAIILEELGLPYESKYWEFADLKTLEYESMNPNGRTPTLVDPNNGNFTIWESGAIVQYLVDRYDTEGKISHKPGDEKYIENQWLQFQMSGQGPYFGQGEYRTISDPLVFPDFPYQPQIPHLHQLTTLLFSLLIAAWFSRFHPESLPSAKSRYINEINRVNTVLNSALKGKKYLLGDKISYADLSFVTWHVMIPFILGEEKLETDGKNTEYERWMSGLLERPAVKKVLEEKGRKMAEGH